MSKSDFVPVKTDMISANVVSNPRACAGLVFWTNLKLVKVDSEYTNVLVNNYPWINWANIRFIIFQEGERKSSGHLELTVKKQVAKLEH